MFKSFLAVAALAIGLGAAGQASAITVDFDDIADDTNISGVELKGGVTITAGESAVIVNDLSVFEFAGLSSPNAIDTDPFFSDDAFRADFASELYDISVNIGDFGGDSDTLFLRAFDSAGTLLDSTTLFVASGVRGLFTLSLTDLAGAAYVEFGSTGEFNNSVFADTLEFNVAPVPVPAGLPLALSGLLGLAYVARRRRT